MPELNGKVAVVTGASSGIGRAIAGAFAAAGATVVLAARGEDRLQAAAAEIAEAGGRVRAIAADVTDEEQVQRLFSETRRHCGDPDLLVNNAGTATAAPLPELSLAEWRRVLDINLTAAFLCSREAFRLMQSRRSGRIINIGSVAAYVPRPATAPYTASKAGLEGLTHCLALEGRDYGITACVLHPGNTRSGFWEQRPDLGDQEGIMQPEDVARMALTIAAMPEDVLVLRTVMLPLTMPFLGRG